MILLGGTAPRRGELALAMYLRWHQAHEDAQFRVTAHQGRRGPTAEESLSFAAGLHAAEARDLLGRARPAPPSPSDDGVRRPSTDPGAPVYLSWEDFLAQTRAAEVMAWCRAKAKKANGRRLMSGESAGQINAQDVWDIMAAGHGTCAYCGSLAVQKRPSTTTGQPLPWEDAGRRIGSLSHIVSRFDGGTNMPDNLCWSCLWCNTDRSEGRLGATDHGGIQPRGDLCDIAGCGVVRPKDADSPLRPDRCPEHGQALGELCTTCLAVMSEIRSGHCLDTRISLRDAYREHYNRCSGCEPLIVLPARDEVHRCREVVTAPPGDKGFRVRHDALWTGWPGNFTFQDWVELVHNAAEAAGMAVDEYVAMVAQAPHHCGRCESEAARVHDSITKIAGELARLRRIHGSLYRITFDPLSLWPWQAHALGTRRKPLEADSPGGLRLRIGEDKRAAARRAVKRSP
jgi:hypothetical protein